MGADQVAQPSSLPFFLMLGAFFILMYLFTIRPRQKKEKEHRNLLSGIVVGDEIITYSGILGKITKIKEPYITVSISDNVEIKLQKTYIANVLPKGTLKSI